MYNSFYKIFMIRIYANAWATQPLSRSVVNPASSGSEVAVMGIQSVCHFLVVCWLSVSLSLLLETNLVCS